MEAMENDCVNPSVVFPSFIASPTKRHVPALNEGHACASVSMEDGSVNVEKGTQENSSDPDWEDSSEEYTSRRSYEREPRRKSERKLSTVAVGPGGNSRHQPQSELSTSGED